MILTLIIVITKETSTLIGIITYISIKLSLSLICNYNSSSSSNRNCNNNNNNHYYIINDNDASRRAQHGAPLEKLVVFEIICLF